jgi:hypothetical protein
MFEISLFGHSPAASIVSFTKHSTTRPFYPARAAGSGVTIDRRSPSGEAHAVARRDLASVDLRE